VKLLARVASSPATARWVQLVPNGRPLELTMRPRLPVGALICARLPGCPAPTDDAITAWLAHAYHERDVRVLRPTSFAPATLADLLDAVDADRHVAAAAEFSADAVTAFARASGGALLAEIRGELEHAVRPAAVIDRVRRFAAIVAGDATRGVLAELAMQHDVEHLLGLEHAVAQWIADAGSPRQRELAALARGLPDDDVSAGISQVWFHWWWRLARACTRVDLMTIVDRAVDHADEHCTQGRRTPIADDARAEARRMADRMRDTRRAVLWSEPPPPAPARRTLVPDDDDAHYAAFMAVSHAAHALAHALGGQMSAAAANRAAMQTVAELAVGFLLDEPA